MEFNNFELSLILMLVEGKIKDLNMLLCDLEVNKDYMDLTEYRKLYGAYSYSLESTRLLKNKIIKYLEE